MRGALLERRLDLGQRDAARLQQHQQMIEQIGGFRDQPVAVFLHGGDHGLDRLLAELLGAMRDALVEQLAGIGLRRARLGALVHPLFEIGT